MMVMHARHSARMRVAPHRGNGLKRMPVRAQRQVVGDTHR